MNQYSTFKVEDFPPSINSLHIIMNHIFRQVCLFFYETKQNLWSPHLLDSHAPKSPDPGLTNMLLTYPPPFTVQPHAIKINIPFQNHRKIICSVLMYKNILIFTLHDPMVYDQLFRYINNLLLFIYVQQK